MSPRRGSYGTDAPGLVGGFATSVVVLVVIGVVTGAWSWFVTAAVLAIIAAIAWHSTRRGRFVVWAELLDALGLRGDERVLEAEGVADRVEIQTADPARTCG